MDVPAPGDGLRAFGIDGAQHLGRVGERPRAEYPPDDLAPRGRVGHLVERGAEHGGAERRVGEGIHRVDRARLSGGYAPVIDPAARTQLGQHRVPGSADLADGQQAAEKQVTIVRQAPPQPVGVVCQMRGIGQLVHTPTVSSGR